MTTSANGFSNSKISCQASQVQNPKTIVAFSSVVGNRVYVGSALLRDVPARPLLRTRWPTPSKIGELSSATPKVQIRSSRHRPSRFEKHRRVVGETCPTSLHDLYGTRALWFRTAAHHTSSHETDGTCVAVDYPVAHRRKKDGSENRCRYVVPAAGLNQASAP